MTLGAGPPGQCPHCGAANPPGVAMCQFCRGALFLVPGTAYPPPPPGYSNFRLVTRPEPDARGIIALVVGTLLLLAGVGLLVDAAVAHDGVQMYNQGCSQIPNCTPQSDPSGALAAGGAVLLVVGLILIGWGVVNRDEPKGADYG